MMSIQTIWRRDSRKGSLDTDPYARAVNARRGDIPLAIGEGMLLTAASDDDGRVLDATCTYRLAGVTPPARAWTITVTGRGAPATGQEPVRTGFTSTEILRETDGRFAILLSPEVQAGNGSFFHADTHLSRRGAAVKNLAHSASLHSSVKTAPSNPGIKQLRRRWT